MGPASYIVTAADLQHVTAGNHIFKYADDTYLVIPAANSTTALSEILHIVKWAAENNLKLNCAKSKELIFTAKSSRATSTQLPVECLNIERVTSLRILGVIISNRLTATEHVNNNICCHPVLASCMLCVFYEFTAPLFRRYMMFSVQQSLRRSSTVHQPGPEYARQPIFHG